MSSLPSPSPNRNTADSAYYYYHYPQHQPDASMKNLLTSTWHVLDQPPPPSLREILGAYKAKGDGDRDMLLAMLNAKSAEDQRLASVASLHRTLIEIYQTPVPPPPLALHVSDGHSSHMCQQHFPSPPTTSYHHSPPLIPQLHSNSHSSPRSRHRGDSSASAATSSASHTREREYEVPSNSRKRRRTSRSPPREHRVRSSAPDTHTSQQQDLPLSPYSSTSTHSSGGSPRSRESMAIGSLLSSSETHTGPKGCSTNRRTSSERSTTSSTSPVRR